MRAFAGLRGILLVSLAAFTLLLTMLPQWRAAADPAPPGTISISERPTMAVVSWSAVPEAQGYVVELDTATDFPHPRRVITTSTITVFPGLTPATPYVVRIAAWGEQATAAGAWGATQAFTTAAQVFTLAPPKISIAKVEETSLTLTWKSLGEGLTYEAAIGTDPNQLDQVKSVDGLSASFTKLSKDTKYYLSARALDASGNPVTEWSDAVDEETAANLPLRVGSYNILCENCSGGKASWATRRGPLVSTIKGQDLDVLGVQEASYGKVPGGGPQYLDLIQHLGSPYKLTEYGRKVSPDVRIIYNSERVKLIKQGIIKLPKGSSQRYLDWAVMEQKSTGKRFFFANTHLEPKNADKYNAVLRRQANAVVATLKKLGGKLPVITVGDFASTKWDDDGNIPYDIMQAGGYLDPLGNSARSKQPSSAAFVEKRINTSYSSYNLYKRKAKRLANQVNGSHVDYIFVTKMRVSEYEVVVKVNSSGDFVGVIPSDHNLIRATVFLP